MRLSLEDDFVICRCLCSVVVKEILGVVWGVTGCCSQESTVVLVSIEELGEVEEEKVFVFWDYWYDDAVVFWTCNSVCVDLASYSDGTPISDHLLYLPIDTCVMWVDPETYCCDEQYDLSRQ